MLPNPGAKPPSARAARTRARIVKAAAAVIDREGLAHVTTKEIAREAGYSEALLYKHFRDKEELVLVLLNQRLEPLVQAVVDLPDRAGTRSVGDHLREMCAEFLRVFAVALPTAMSMLAEPRLLERQRALLEPIGGGPHKANDYLADYLRREQDLGRVAEDALPEAVADTVVGACFQRAFLIAFFGGTDWTDRDEGRFIDELVRTTLRALA